MLLQVVTYGKEIVGYQASDKRYILDCWYTYQLLPSISYPEDKLKSYYSHISTKYFFGSWVIFRRALMMKNHPESLDRKVLSDANYNVSRPLGSMKNFLIQNNMPNLLPLEVYESIIKQNQKTFYAWTSYFNLTGKIIESQNYFSPVYSSPIIQEYINCFLL